MFFFSRKMTKINKIVIKAGTKQSQIKIGGSKLTANKFCKFRRRGSILKCEIGTSRKKIYKQIIALKNIDVKGDTHVTVHKDAWGGECVINLNEGSSATIDCIAIQYIFYLKKNTTLTVKGIPQMLSVLYAGVNSSLILENDNEVVIKRRTKRYIHLSFEMVRNNEKKKFLQGFPCRPLPISSTRYFNTELGTLLLSVARATGNVFFHSPPPELMEMKIVWTGYFWYDMKLFTSQVNSFLHHHISLERMCKSITKPLASCFMSAVCISLTTQSHNLIEKQCKQLFQILCVSLKMLINNILTYIQKEMRTSSWTASQLRINHILDSFAGIYDPDLGTHMFEESPSVFIIWDFIMHGRFQESSIYVSSGECEDADISKEESECSICFNCVPNGVVQPCAHIICLCCARLWCDSTTHFTCPICRTSVIYVNAKVNKRKR